jgi:enterochelin esterase-like enzyme
MGFVTRHRPGAAAGAFVSETFAYDGGRQVTAYVPARVPEVVVFAGDGQLITRWGPLVEAADVPATLLVGAHRPADETLRLHEYSPGFDPMRFAAHERFFVEDVLRWTRSRFEVTVEPDRTAILGVSAGAELALALGLRHPDLYGAVFCASPGAGFRPPEVLPARLPRTYLVAGTREPFFRDNARRWASALADGGGRVVMRDRDGGHGDPFWSRELPLMIDWAFGQET